MKRTESVLLLMIRSFWKRGVIWQQQQQHMQQCQSGL
jgi:hypothetical protein